MFVYEELLPAGIERVLAIRLAGDARYRSADAAKAYMAFGAGPRACIGQQLALSIASLALARMVHAAATEGLLDDDDDNDDDEWAEAAGEEVDARVA